MTLQRVFADEEPSDVLPAHGVFLRTGDRAAPDVPPRDLPGRFRPGGFRDPRRRSRRPLERRWVTILLLGSDEGPGQRATGQTR